MKYVFGALCSYFFGLAADTAVGGNTNLFFEVTVACAAFLITVDRIMSEDDDTIDFNDEHDDGFIGYGAEHDDD